MGVRAIFAVSAAMSLASCAVISALYVWPWLRVKRRDRALVSLVAPHMFLRFIGLSFLVPGVVSPALPPAFAVPAAYGDFIAGILAIIATIALAKRASWAVAAAWVFNVWGAADLLYAFYAGPHAHIDPGTLGAAFYLPTAIVPVLLTTHFLIFGLLAHKSRVTLHSETAK
jgi:hypothetical protein